MPCDAFEEAIVLVRMLSGGGPPVTYQGRHYRVNQIEPAPVAAPPVWTGSVGPKSLAATGRVADGWIPGHAADWLSERYRESRPVIDEAAAAVGRDPREIRTVFNLPGRITDRPLAATRDRDGRWIGGSVDQWVEELTGAVLEHDASGFMLFSPGGGAPDAVSLGRWARRSSPPYARRRSRMQYRALEHFVHGVAGAVHGQPHELEVVTGHRAHGGPVRLVVAGGEHLLGVDGGR